jgi:peptidyl-prolyl cis-trans isomerase C
VSRPTQLLALLLTFILAACGGGNSPAPTIAVTSTPANPTAQTNATPQSAPPVSTPGAPPQNAAGAQVLAKVNGEAITLPQFQRALARRQQEIEASDPAALQKDVLDQLIEQVLIRQGAAAQNITVSDADVQVELKSYVDQAGSADAWQKWLDTNLYTQDEFTSELRSTLINNKVRDSLTQDLGGDVNQVHARHILVQTEAEANAIMTRLKAGEDFGALAKALSKDDTTRDSGGDLGWFTADELLVPQLTKTAFALQPNQIGGPVATELGYHIVQTLEFAKRSVDPDRRAYIAQTRFENWLKPLYAKSTIERYQ